MVKEIQIDFLYVSSIFRVLFELIKRKCNPLLKEKKQQDYNN